MSSTFPAKSIFRAPFVSAAAKSLRKVNISPKTEAVSAKVSGVDDNNSP